MSKTSHKMIADILKNKISLTREQQDETILLYSQTNDLTYRDRVVNSILPLIYNIANSYSKRTGVDVFVLYMEGYYGALRSVDKYKFGTSNFYVHASSYIKKYILTCITKEFMDGFGMAENLVPRYRKSIEDGQEEKFGYIETVYDRTAGQDVNVFEILVSDEESIEDILINVENKQIVNNLIVECFEEEYRPIVLGDSNCVKVGLELNISKETCRKNYNIMKEVFVDRVEAILA